MFFDDDVAHYQKEDERSEDFQTHGSIVKARSFGPERVFSHVIAFSPTSWSS